jgi:hypothetical protein
MTIKNLKEEHSWFLNKYNQLKAREKLLQSPYLKVEADLTNCLCCLVNDIMTDIEWVNSKNYKEKEKKWRTQDSLYVELRHQADQMGCEFQRAFYNECLKYTGRLLTNFRV